MIEPQAERPSESRSPEARICDVRVLLSAAAQKTQHLSHRARKLRT